MPLTSRATTTFGLASIESKEQVGSVAKNKKQEANKLNKNLNLDQIDREILRIIIHHNTNKMLSKYSGHPKATISYHTSKLEKMGLIIGGPKSHIRILELTEKGRLTRSTFSGLGEQEDALNPLIRAHNLHFSSDIIRAPPEFEQKLKESNWLEFRPNNYVAYKKSVDGVWLVFTPRKVQYYLGTIYSNKEEVLNKVLNKVIMVKQQLEADYPNLILGKPERVAVCHKQHLAWQYSPLAKQYFKHKLATGETRTYRSDRMHIDFSDKGIPEQEFVHPAHAPDDLETCTQFHEDLIRGNLNPWKTEEKVFNFERSISITLPKLAEAQEKMATSQLRFYQQFGQYMMGNFPIWERVISTNQQALELTKKISDYLETPTVVRWLRWFFKKISSKKNMGEVGEGKTFDD